MPNDRRPQGAFIWPPKSESEDQAPLKGLFFDEDMKPKKIRKIDKIMFRYRYL